MSTAAAKPAAKAGLFDGPAKLWKKSKPGRVVMMWIFVLHGWLQLGADIAARRAPFFIDSLTDWALALGSAWNDFYAWWQEGGR